MRTEDRPKFVMILEAVGSCFNRSVDEPLLYGYWAAFKGVDLAVFELACHRAIDELDFFPTVKQLKGITGQRDAAEMAADAWAKVLELARDSTRAEHPDPVAEAAIKKLGGWRKIGQTDEDRLEWVRKEFVDLYQAAAKHRPQLQAPEKKELTA